MTYNFSAEIIFDNEINRYIALVPGLPGAHTQAKSLDSLYQNLQEVIKLCLEELTDEEKKSLPQFIGTQMVSVAV